MSHRRGFRRIRGLSLGIQTRAEQRSALKLPIAFRFCCGARDLAAATMGPPPGAMNLSSKQPELVTINPVFKSLAGAHLTRYFLERHCYF